MTGSPTPPRGRIVVGVDGSPLSRQALRWALRQGRLSGEEVHAYIAWRSSHDFDGDSGDLPVDWEGGARRALERVLLEYTREEADGIDCHVVHGHPAQVLLEAAEDADLLVVGSRGHGAFTGLLLGSVSQHVIAHAPCPVVVVQGDRLPPAPAEPAVAAGAAPQA